MHDSLFSLHSKVAIVTGGNGGIGLGIALGLAEAGASISIAARDEFKIDRAIELIRETGSDVIGVTIDVADEKSVSMAVNETVGRFGQVDILVNNAGISVRSSPEKYTAEEWDQVVGINLKGTFLCSKEVYPHMVTAGGGKIVNIGSMTSVFGIDWAAPYASSKGGIVQLSKSLAVSWAKNNIQVNTILPGWINTDLTQSIERDFPDRHALITSRIPHGRWGEPQELAGTAVFLASQASDYITGVSIPVDGGYTSF